MYSEFRDLLASAEGGNEWVVAINADIRGFSSVMSGDPAQTALYLRGVYGKILDGYFEARSFFKPTGDGLLLIVPFAATEAELESVTRVVVGDALRLHDDFADIIESDKLVRFAHPDRIGIGLSVGSVSRLVAGDLTLDYTGRALNVATRLMDLARPSGVVLDNTLDFSALETGMASRFRPDHVYLEGVADEDGVDIYFTVPPTEIPERHRKPLRPPVRFEESDQTFTRRGVAARGRYHIALTHEPADRSGIEVLVFHPQYSASRQRTGIRSWFEPEFEYVLHRGRPHVAINFPKIRATLTGRRVPASTECSLSIAYMIDPELVRPEDEDDDIPF
jgi:hypothetical protein